MNLRLTGSEPVSSVLWTLEGVTLGTAPRPRLAEIDLTLLRGVTAVLGYSGAGKTSLLNVLAGFERPDRGTVRWHDPGSPRALFWAPSDHGLWPSWTVRQHVQRVSPAGCDGMTWLERFDLQGLADSRPGTLSLGERSRLSLARALATQAAVLVLDEPLAHVDPARAGRYLDVVREWTAVTSGSVVFATHSPEAAILLAQSAVCLHDGRMVHAGSVDALYHQPHTAELGWFLGPLNVLSSQDWRDWLGGEPPHSPICLRPERLAVVPGEGPLLVIREQFQGSVASVELQHLALSQSRTWWHRPASGRLQPGDRVKVVLR